MALLLVALATALEKQMHQFFLQGLIPAAISLESAAITDLETMASRYV
jgi:hypothetical protein